MSLIDGLQDFTCPKCTKEVSERYPATSRHGLGDICTPCGVAEALGDFYKHEAETLLKRSHALELASMTINGESVKSLLPSQPNL